jgi:membrane protease YdiL (CAAX protease family)
MTERLRYFYLAAICIGLFMAIYAPAFALISILGLLMTKVVPFVIGFTLLMSIVYIFVINKVRRITFSDFGFNRPVAKYFLIAALLALPIALLITWGLSFANEKSPLGDVAFTTVELFIYFGIGAAVQEEIIFRGLMQSLIRKELGEKSILFSVLLTAIFFALIHLQVGIFTALGALVLGLLAGYFRVKSNTVWAPIFIHAIFNLSSIIWM